MTERLDRGQGSLPLSSMSGEYSPSSADQESLVGLTLVQRLHGEWQSLSKLPNEIA